LSNPIVLIVDDDAAFAYAAARHLASLGYTTLIATGSLAAFREMENNSVDVVITDVKLNKGEPHGVALGRMLRSAKPHLPVILVTAYPDILKDAVALPGPVLEKPVELDDLAKAVRAALKRQG
jgi:DNA-binding NtrC family response regulator